MASNNSDISNKPSKSTSHTNKRRLPNTVSNNNSNGLCNDSPKKKRKINVLAPYIRLQKENISLKNENNHLKKQCQHLLNVVNKMITVINNDSSTQNKMNLLSLTNYKNNNNTNGTNNNNSNEININASISNLST
eukprot:117578_1